MGRKLRCHLDLLQPNTSSRVLDKQRTQKKQHDKKTKDRTFKLHDPVFVKDFTHHRRWLPGCITGFEGSQTAVIKLNDGTITRRHFDHFKKFVHVIHLLRYKMIYPLTFRLNKTHHLM